MRKLVASLVLLSFMAVLMGAGVLGSARAYAAPHIVTDGPMKLKLSSTMAGVTFDGNTLICPAVLITTSSGVNGSACEFEIESIGTLLPTSVAVNMTVTGITPAQLSSRKFAIDPQPGALLFFSTASQTVYSFTGAQLPATVKPGLAWGANAGSALDNSDLGVSIVVTYTVVAESVESASGTPGTTPTPFESVGAETAMPGQTSTPPPTASGNDPSSSSTPPRFALLICLLLAVIGLIAAGYQRRRVRRKIR